jgi:hypothetical protein
MNRNQLRKLCQRNLRELGLTPPLEVEQLRVALGLRRGRPILIAPSDELAGRRKFGFTWDDPSADAVLIMYEARTTWTHQMMIILHELAHLICEHPGAAIDHSYRADHGREFQEISPFALAQVLGTAPPRKSKRERKRQTRLGASLYDEPAEWEAETMATIMSEWVPGLGAGTGDRPADDPLAAILGDVTAW